MNAIRRWTSDDDTRLRELLPTHSLEQIGLLIGRTTHAVRRRRTQLHTRRRRSSANTPLTAAQAKLVAAHVRWAETGAAKHAYRFRRYVTEDDLRSAAYMGLVMAARRFDPARGLAFKTLAFTYCESLMRREVDTRRRQDGCVFDPRIEGGMRTVLQRIDWPVHPDGTPQELGALPATQAQVTHAKQQRRLVLAACPAPHRPILKLALAGLDNSEIARRVQRSPSRVFQVLAAVVPVIRRRLATRQVRTRAKVAA